ncbi:lytic transglycosylase domain-containing protein, partial [Escherichia coli]|nr:lytic transglycosylase domain-containing protein [Escherichia coli]
IAQLAIKNPWLLMFIPANNTPTTSEEMASIGGIGSNIVPERQQAYEALRKENPGKDFFTDEQIQRKIQEMGLEPEQ